MIIGISGRKSCGKDTAGQIITDNFGFKKMSFAAPIKDLVAKTFNLDRGMLEGLSEEQRRLRELPNKHLWNYSGRELLQIIGCSFRDDIHYDVWVKILEEQYLAQKENIVITDVRFPNEINMINKHGFVINLTRDTVKSNDSHQSETSLEGCEHLFKYSIYNNDTIRSLNNVLVNIVEGWN